MGRLGVLVLVVTAGLGLSTVSPALAAPGDLDPGFGGDGRVTTNFGEAALATSMGIQADGKVVVAGTSIVGSQSSLALARYNPDGSLDTTFGTDGKVTTDLGPGSESATALAIQGDGRIVVAGQMDMDVAVVRYNASGSLDTTFDTDGKVVTDFGRNESASAIAIQADSRIVVAGSGSTPDTPDSDFVLARYNTNGSLDTTFDTDGKVVTDFGKTDRGNDIALQADAKLVVIGTTSTSTAANVALARYGTNGSLDTTFSGDGKEETDLGGDEVAGAVAIQANGRIVVAGSVVVDDVAAEFFLARYTTTGGLDDTFDSDGSVVTYFQGADGAADLAIQSDGKLLVAGFSASQQTSLFALARYDVNGALDPSFNVDGRVVTGFGADQVAGASALAVQADGRIVLAGHAGSSTSEFALVRYLNSGSPTPPGSHDFDGDGKTDMVVWRPSEGVWYVRSSSADFNDFTTRLWGLNGDVPIANSDFDGDRRADLAVWRPSEGTWFVLSSASNPAGGYIQRPWGQRGDIPLANSDFDGDGKADMALWRPSNGTWYVRTSSSNFDGFIGRQWGLPGDVPLPSSDLDGDGKADMVVWRPSNGTWFVRTSSSGFDSTLTRQWGLPGDVPLASSDLDGDNKDDMVVWRPSNGTWYVRTSSSGFDSTLVRQWGLPGDVPLLGSDFDGDGKADMVVWRPSNGTWYVRTSSSNFDGFLVRQWGVNGDLPLANADFDGDGKADMVVWRPSNGTWYVRTSLSNFDSFLVQQWGLNGDVVVTGGP